jgi:uncharacterized membrane protein YidH (DUF202 family)
MTPAPDDRTLFDNGLQLERTHLAWSRTALGFLAVAILVARLSRQFAVPAVGIAAAAGFALVGSLAWWHGRSNYPRRSATLVGGGSPLHARTLRLVAVATAMLSFATAAAALTITSAQEKSDHGRVVR